MKQRVTDFFSNEEMNQMKEYQKQIDLNIFRKYVKNVKLKYLEDTASCPLNVLAQIYSTDYLTDVLNEAKTVIPVEYLLLYIYSYLPTTVDLDEVNSDYINMIRDYPNNKDHKYFSWWMNEYFNQNAIKEELKEMIQQEVTVQDITPGQIIYNIGYYSTNPVTIDEMIATNIKYCYYIITQFDNSPFDYIFYYIYKQLLKIQEAGNFLPDKKIETCIPLKTLKNLYYERFTDK